MLTRGHLIGQLVDDLAGIAAQARLRGQLHLFDLNIHVEQFSAEVLNRVLKLKLANLNGGRKNNPGLDLGDKAAGWAFQVTADKSGTKVKETLEKIDQQQRQDYPNIRVLVIGEKQGSYTCKGEPYETFKFTQDMVWDLNDVCSRLMSMEIQDLTELARHVSSETQRVRMELEVTDEHGNYPTNIEKFVEALPKPVSSTAAGIAKYYADKYPVNPPKREKLEQYLSKLSTVLATLPRLTREIFKLILERKDPNPDGLDLHRISDAKLKRICRTDDLDTDLSLLEAAGLVTQIDPVESRQLVQWEIRLPGTGEQFQLQFFEYVEARNLDLRKVIVVLDFSDF